MSLPPPPQDDDPIITQFRPQYGQWELTDDNSKRIDLTTGETILLNYCKKINSTPLEVYRYLIETKGCDVNVQDMFNYTPIFYALRYFNPSKGGNITVLHYLLTQKDVNGNIKDECGYTIFHYACGNINHLPLDIFQYLIETLGGDVNLQNKDKNTPLHSALGYFNPNDGGDITVLTYLINQKNVNVNIEGESGYTLLHTACQQINNLPIEIFELLIEAHGFDVNAQDKCKDTPIVYALRNFNPGIGGDITVPVLHYLLDQNGVDANINGQNGGTLLHTACEKINYLPLDAFKVLIEAHGCDVNEKDDKGDTPLHYAIRSFNATWGGNITVLMYVLNQKSINVNVKGKYGYTLLHLACQQINNLPVDIFKLLIETIGFDLNALNMLNDTPLHQALFHFKPDDGGDINVLTYLIDQMSVNLNIKGEYERTLLHDACISNLAGSWDSAELNAECDSILCQIVEMIVERCVEQVLDGKTS
jgi:ankyrin repeat protein